MSILLSFFSLGQQTCLNSNADYTSLKNVWGWKKKLDGWSPLGG